MRISVVLIVVVAAVNVIGRPHNDGTDHTHSPVIVPDSESLINVEGHNEAAVHHSDVGLGNFTSSSKTDVSRVAPAQSEILAETHHGDTFMTSGQTAKPKQPVGLGHAPMLHVDHSGTTEEHLGVDAKIASVVSHGPMAKNVDNHEVKHNHDQDHGRHGHHDKHSTVHHAPMATEHHPKTGNAHHPQLSKTEPASAHAPFAHPEEHHKHDDIDDAINEEDAVTSTVNHPASDHHAQKTYLAHHPSLSKSDIPLSHAPFAIPHGIGEVTFRKKRSGPGGLSSPSHPKTPPRESIEEYPDSGEYPSKEIEDEEKVRLKRSKGSNQQKSYARKTTTTTTTTTIAPASSSDATDPSGKTDGSAIREKRSKGSNNNQKSNVRKTTATTTTVPAPAPTAKEVFEASHRGSSEEQDSKEQRNKKPEESEFRQKRSKGSNRKPAAYTRTTVTTTEEPKTTLSTAPTETHRHDEGEQKSPREKRSKGSNQKSYARKVTTTTSTTVAPTTVDALNPTESSVKGESQDGSEKTETRSKRSKGSNQSYAKKPTTRNYATSTVSSAVVTGDATSASEKLEVRVKRSKGNYQKTQPRKTTTTTTTAKPTTSGTTVGGPEAVSTGTSPSSISPDDVTSEKTVRNKRSKGSNQNSYKRPQTTTTTVPPKAPEPEAPASNVHHPSLSKTEPLNPAKPEESKISKTETGNPVTVPDPLTKAQPPQIIPGSHPLAIPLPTNPPFERR